MVTSKATTVAEYLQSLPAERRKTVSAVRRLVRKHLAKGFVERMQHGMIAWVVPLSRYPETYNDHPLPVVCLAAQKSYVSLYLLGIYADARERKRFEASYGKSGKRLSMGKSCVRFASLDDLAQDAVRDALGRASVDGFIALYEKSRARAR